MIFNILVLLIGSVLYNAGVFTLKGAVMFYIIEFILYLIVYPLSLSKSCLDEIAVEYDLDEIENESFRKEVEQYKENHKEDL